MPKMIDLTGQRYGSLTVISIAEQKSKKGIFLAGSYTA